MVALWWRGGPDYIPVGTGGLWLERNLLQRLRDLLHIGQAGKEQLLAGNPTSGTTGREQELQPYVFPLLSKGLSKIFLDHVQKLQPTSSFMLQAFIVISSSWRRECEAVEDSRDRLNVHYEE
eukprot:s5939_g2.t1